MNAAPDKVSIVTSSWDDDDRTNLKVAELLAARKLPGTFYVTSGGLGKGLALSITELRSLSDAGFEIGAHSVSHAILPQLNRHDLAREVAECKTVLEQALGRKVTSFAYPKGRYNADVIAEVKQAGYHCARGVRLLSISYNFPPFEMPISIQAYPHRRTSYVKNLVRRREVAALLKSSRLIAGSNGWVALGKALYDRVLREGGVWHLSGHSWQTEKIAGWSELEQMLDYVTGHTGQGVEYLTNAELFQRTRSRGTTSATL